MKQQPTISDLPVELRKMPLPPILIGGAGRSGTTLLLSALAATPTIYTFLDETTAFETDPFRLDKLVLKHPVSSEHQRWLEKTPMHCRSYKRIIDFFGGDVKIINLVRDGRDVVTSKYPAFKQRYFIHPKDWVESVKAGRDVENLDCVLTIRYEDLVTDFVNTIDRVCDFAQIDEIMRYYIYRYPEYTPKRESEGWHQGGVALPFDSSIGRWKDPEHADRVAELMARPGAEDLLFHYGYEL